MWGRLLHTSCREVPVGTYHSMMAFSRYNCSTISNLLYPVFARCKHGEKRSEGGNDGINYWGSGKGGWSEPNCLNYL